MNKVVWTIALLLVSCYCRGQNWAPFGFSESHHYRSDTGTWIARTIRIDSLTGDSSETVWHFPRLLLRTDANYAVMNAPHFCQRAMRLLGDGRYQFFDPGNVWLAAEASPGAVALVDSIHGAIGVVTRVYPSAVLGVPDSLKVISMTGGDSLVLSKTHGLVEWPASLGPQRYVLVGLQSQHLGDTLPGFDGFFNYKVGNVYCWSVTIIPHDFWLPNSMQPAPSIFDLKLKILTALRDRNGLHLTMERIGRNINGYSPKDIAQWDIPLVPEGFAHRGQDELFALGDWLQPYFVCSFYPWCPNSTNSSISNFPVYSSVQYIRRNDSTLMTFGTDLYEQAWWHGYPGAPSDTLVPRHWGGDHIEISEGLGHSFTHSTHNSDQWWSWLKGYVIDGDTTGNVWPDSLPEPPSIPEWTLWPNPTDDLLHLAIPADWKGDAQVIDMAGRLVRQYPMEGPIATLSLGDMRAGVYVLRFVYGDFRFSRRFVVAH